MASPMTCPLCHGQKTHKVKDQIWRCTMCEGRGTVGHKLTWRSHPGEDGPLPPQKRRWGL